MKEGARDTLTKQGERRRNRLALDRESIELVQSVCKRSVFTVIQDNRIVYAGPSATLLSGYSEKELATIELATLLAPGWRDNGLRAVRRAAKVRNGSGVEVEVVLKTKQGEERWVRCSMRPALWEGRPALLCDGFDITQYKNTEAALRESEERFRSISTNAQAILGIVQNDRFVYVNEFASQLTGYATNELIGMKIEQLVHPEHRTFVLRRAARRLKGYKEPPQYECKIITKNGKTLWIELAASRISYHGRSAILVIATDRTSRKETEQELQNALGSLGEQKELFEIAIEAAGMTVWTFDPLHNKVQSLGRSPDWSRIVKEERFTLFGGVTRLIHPDDRKKILSMLPQAIAGKPFNFEFRMQHPDNTMHWNLARGRLVAGHRSDQPLRIAGVALDINDRKLAEEGARERQRTLEILLQASEFFLSNLSSQEILEALAAQISSVDESAGIAIGEYDHSSHTIRVRAVTAPPERMKRLRELMGHSPTDMRFNVTEMLRDQMISDYLKHLPGGVYDLSFQQIPRELCETLERELNIGAVYTMTFARHADFMGTVAIMTDKKRGLKGKDTIELLAHQAGIALRRSRAEAALIKASEDKNNFLAILAHELRNPLAPIASSTDLLKLLLKDENRDSSQNDPAARNALEMIAHQLESMKRLLDDLLDLSRVERGMVEIEQKPVVLENVLRSSAESVQSFMSSLGHTFELDIQPEGPYTVTGDPVRLEQIIVNLLNNAAKYTPEHGRVRLSLEKQDESALIRVKDNGIGLDPSMTERIFDLFNQANVGFVRSHGGLGIGLTLAKNLVTMHGGTITAESPGPGQGATFTVCLPLAKSLRKAPATLPGGPPSMRNGPPLPALRILVVDDNKEAATSLVRLLQFLGQYVRVAHDAASALKLSGTWHPELYFIDIRMPGMDGYQLSQKLHRRPTSVGEPYYIALTGYGAKEDRAKAEQAGFNQHVVKPISIGQLRTLVAKSAAVVQ